MKIYQRIMLALMFTHISACQAQSTSDNSAPKSVKLTATRCFGTCPAYDLTIYNDGHLAFNG